MNIDLLKAKIAGLINNGEKSFVIYPYGKNGRYIKQVIENEFQISMTAIVDNNLCKTDSSIINEAQLKGIYGKNTYIILSVEDTRINSHLYQNLVTFCDVSHILNVLDFQNNDFNDYRLPDFKPFYLRNMLNIKNKEKSKKIIKIRILNFSQATWNAIHTICFSCKEDAEIDLLIIMSNRNLSDKMRNVIEREKYQYVLLNEYDIENDRPDILVISHPYDSFSQIEKCREYCKLIVVASMQLVRYAHSWSSFIQTQMLGFGRFYPDYYLFDSLLYNDMKNAGFCMDNIVEMGNAKYDGIYQNLQSKEYPGEWSKIKGKKVILWTTDHGIHDGRITSDVTIDLYGKFLFQYANEHPEIGFIFRPHKTLISELIASGLWSNNDVDELRIYCEESKNIIFDELLTYDSAFSLADAIITDAYCGITCSALPLLKPMCLLYRDKSDIPYHKEIDECNYSARSNQDIEKFLSIVINEKDDKLEIRKRNANKCVKHFDGKNGDRIKDFLKQKFLEG